MQAILTIGGSDSSAGAGIQADIKTIAANGAYGLTVVTAVTAQNARAITASVPMPSHLITAQCTAAFEAFDIAAIKSGMLVDSERISAIAQALRCWGAPHYILDPVMNASSGYPLLEPNAVATLLDELAPMAELVTPNVPEAECMTGRPIHSLEDAGKAARMLIERGCRAVLVKGGHLAEAPATDLLVTPETEQLFPGQPEPTAGASGTGCAYSAAIATHLGRGEVLIEAIGKAKDYVTKAIRHGPAVGEGPGAMDHFHAVRFDSGHGPMPPSSR